MANTRQEVVNTFDKGMIKDLNPINTPANVLTDCLNGTYITYDGNEFQLQNDRGNISLKYSKLREGYLPVGTTSYGDILYIVSYNPLENRTQIGTFPSPKLLSNYDHDCDLENPSIMTQEGDGVIKYTEAIDRHQQLVVYFGDKDELIINPGDQYNIEPPGEYVEDFEKLEYFIFTENKELINITDLVIPDAQYHYVKWKVPGYFATRWRLPQINENGFSVRTKSITLKDPATATINCQIASDDELIDNLYEKNELFSIELENAEGAVKDNKSLMEDRIVYDSVNYYNTDIKCKVEVEKDDAGKYVKDYQTFLAPYAEGAKKLLFDQFIQASEAIDLNNTFNPENTHIADEYYNYTVNDNKATVNFNIDCSVVSEGEVGLYIDYVPLSAYINKGYSVDGLFSDSDDRDNVFDGIGQNIVELTFDKPEQVYLLRIEMSDGITDPVYCYKILICSEFMNEFDKEQYPDFEAIRMDQWINHLGEIELWLTKDPEFGEPQRDRQYSNEFSDDSDVLINDCFWNASENSVNCFVLPESAEKLRIDTWQRGYTYTIPNVRIEYKHRQKYLYNFCEAIYDSGSKIEFPKAPNSTKNITNGAEGGGSITENIIDNFYVEHKYKDQNEDPTSGAFFDFKPACDKKDLIVIELANADHTRSESSDWANTIFYPFHMGTTTLRTMVWGIRNLESDGSGYYVSNNSNCVNLMTQPKVLESVKMDDRYLVQNIPSSVRACIANFFETENIACCPGVFELFHPQTARATGFSTNYFSNYVFVPGDATAGGDDMCFVFGVFFRTKDSEIFFLPIRQIGDYAGFMHANPGGDEGRERTECGWDNGLWLPLNVISADARWFNPTGDWKVTEVVYNKLLKFLELLKVNTNFAEFTDGFFLERTLLEENIADKLTIRYNCNTTLVKLKIKDTEANIELSSSQSFNNSEYTPKLREMFLIDWTSAPKNVESTGAIVSNKVICAFKDKNSWPYDGENSLDYVAYLYAEQNEIIKTQNDYWVNSVEYQNVASGMSIGFYGEGNSDRFSRFLEILRSTYNSDDIIYHKKALNRISNICVDVSSDSIEQYWAFCVNNNDQYKATYNFEDFANGGNDPSDKNDPRYPLMVSKDMPYMSIINLLNEEEQDEIEP